MYKIYKSVRSDTPWEIYFNEGDNLPYAPIGSTAYNIDTGVIMINDGEKWVEKIGVNNNSSGGIITKQVQADWNQNNEKSVDYVKNKPFGEVTTLSNVLSWDGEFSIDSICILFDEYKGETCHNMTYMMLVSELTPSKEELIGSKMTSFYDGDSDIIILEEYGIQLNDDNTAASILDGEIAIIAYEDNATVYDVTFPKKGIYLANFIENGILDDMPYSYQTYVNKFEIPNYYNFPDVGIKTIDIKYLPENIQSDWNQNDEDSIDFIKNRPFYEHSITTNEIAWDVFTPSENTSRILLSAQGSYEPYIDYNYAFFVNDCTLEGELSNLTLTYSSFSTYQSDTTIDNNTYQEYEYTINSDDSNTIYSDDNKIIYIKQHTGCEVFIVFEDNAMFSNSTFIKYNDIVFPKAGVWFTSYSSFASGFTYYNVTSKITLNSPDTCSFVKKNIKTIDAQYLPMEEITEYVLSKINNGNEVAY